MCPFCSLVCLLPCEFNIYLKRLECFTIFFMQFLNALDDKRLLYWTSQGSHLRWASRSRTWMWMSCWWGIAGTASTMLFTMTCGTRVHMTSRWPTWPQQPITGIAFQPALMWRKGEFASEIIWFTHMPLMCVTDPCEVRIGLLLYVWGTKGLRRCGVNVKAVCHHVLASSFLKRDSPGISVYICMCVWMNLPMYLCVILGVLLFGVWKLGAENLGTDWNCFVYHVERVLVCHGQA